MFHLWYSDKVCHCSWTIICALIYSAQLKFCPQLMTVSEHMYIAKKKKNVERAHNFSKAPSEITVILKFSTTTASTPQMYD